MGNHWRTTMHLWTIDDFVAAVAFVCIVGWLFIGAAS